MKDKAIAILDENRLMAFATARPDGWPQATMVSYANEDLLIYFVISRASQKFANIARDDRVSLVIGHDFHDPATIRHCRSPRALRRCATRSSGSARSSCCSSDTPACAGSNGRARAIRR